jgi:hypothetical protein
VAGPIGESSWTEMAATLFNAKEFWFLIFMQQPGS